MSTAASIHDQVNNDDGTTDDSTQQQQQQPQPDHAFFGKLSFSANHVFGNTGRAIGNLLPTANINAMLQPKFTLPDKNVASQVLMYRQLLHTNCRPGLRLSRPYQATAAQKAVLHMPWWEQGIEESGKMVISYDNLIVRLWMNGAIMPFADLLGSDVDTMITEEGLPPIPHPYWVDRLGFQQPDPVTDFRSGGVLSLAMMVHMVESCMPTCKRFHPGGDAEVLPFGITCINVTDMMAKFLMLAKSTDKMEALMSQKPFWRMFADPNAILALQELSMQMLCNVVVEMNRERRIPSHRKVNPDMPGGGTMDDDYRPVSVFDFTEVLERTERRVRDDLLGAGPSTVDELRSIAGRLGLKYQQQLEQKERRGGAGPVPSIGDAVAGASNIAGSAVAGASNIAGSAVAGASNIAGSAVAGASNIAGSAVAGASNMAVGMFEKIKSTKLTAPTFTNPLARKEPPASQFATAGPTMVDLPPPPASRSTKSEPTLDELLNTPLEDLLNTPIADDWTGVSKNDLASYPPSASTHFSIDDDEDI